MAEHDTYLTMLAPWRVSEPMTAQVPSGGLATPWSSPQVTWLRAQKVADGSSLLAIMNETPIDWLQVASPMPKKDLERLHLDKLANDCWASTGQELLDEIVGEGETPDFQVLINGCETGWEMTQFAIQERRRAQELFFEVTDRVANLPRSKRRHLRGYQVFMWFAGSLLDADGLPFKRSEAEAYDELIEALIAFRPDPNTYRVDKGEPPPQAPPQPIHDIEGVQFIAAPLLGGVPATPFFATTCANFGLVYQSDHHEADEWRKLQERVRRKDKPGTDYLVISAGAPDRMGRCFVAEEVLAQFLIDHPTPLQAEHLKAVILHFWSTGAAYEILEDEPRLLWKGQYASAVPSHQPFARPPSPDDGSEPDTDPAIRPTP